MRAEIITIGDELLIGQVVDTNSAFMAQILNKNGIEIYQVTSVHDDGEHILRAVAEALSRVDIVITTGGLGPTKDDITKHVLCDFFGATLIPSVQVEQHVRKLYADRPDVLNRLTETQWLVPDKCTVLANRVGSAPLMAFEKGGKLLFSLPGVPYEMEIAMREQVMPFIAAKRPTNETIIHRTIQVAGIPESALAIHIEDWENALPPAMHLAYLPKDGIIRLRLSGYFDKNDTSAQLAIDEQIKQLEKLVDEWLVVTEDKPFEVVVGELLKAKHATIATAESCTGGKLASLLNKHAGSSEFYKGSVVAYSNEVKEKVLNVSKTNLELFGAVSEQVVSQMAEGVRKLMNTDYALATSGVAGPGGGTPQKPVGTVWIAIATPQKIFTELLHLKGEREQITDRACTKVLTKLIKYLQD